MAFDISKFIGDVSKINIDINRKQIEYIPLDKIFSDANNRYELSGIEDLAANIEMFGLQQPLEVRPHGSKEGCYTVTSGHRRKAALEMLGENEAPCIVVEPMASQALQELRLIFANSDTRRMTAAEQAWQAERIEKLLYELKEQGYEFPGRMRDHVAALSKMSASKLARLKVIREGLRQPALKKAFEENRMNETTAYELARRGEAVQQRAAGMAEELCTVSTEEAVRILESMEQEAKKPAPVAVKHEPVSSRESVQAYLEQREEEDFEYQGLIRELMLSGTLLAPANVGSRKDNIDSLKLRLRYTYSGSREISYQGNTGKGLSVCREDKRWLTRTWTEAYDIMCGIACEMSRSAIEIENASKISAKPEWQSGTPESEGKHYCKVGCEGATVHQTLIYRDGWRLVSGGHALDESCRVLGWWPLPEE